MACSTLRYFLVSHFIIVWLSHSQLRQHDQQFIKNTLFYGKVRHQSFYFNMEFSPLEYYFDGVVKDQWTQTGAQVGIS